jgi:hypothetical protein
MNTVMGAVSDGRTVSMVEVDAAAARAALAGHLQLAEVDLEHPAVVAVLAAVLAAGWRPPIRSGGNGILTEPTGPAPALPLFGESDAITPPEWSAPPGWPR